MNKTIYNSMNRPFKIGVIAPNGIPLHYYINKTLVNYLYHSSQIPYLVNFYHADGNMFTISQVAEHILTNNTIDLIVTQGATCSYLTQNMSQHINKNIPIVFTCINDPVKLQVAASLESSMNNTTGYSTPAPSYEDAVKAIVKVKPTIKRAIIFIPNQYLDKEQNTLVQHLHQRDIHVQLYYVDKKQSIPFDFKTFDIAFVLRSHTVLASMDAIRDACNRHKVVLCASDELSLKHGAGFSYTSSEDSFGIQAGYIIQQILEDGKHPADIPIVVRNLDYKLMINEKTAASQGTFIDERTKKLLENTVVFKP